MNATQHTVRHTAKRTLRVVPAIVTAAFVIAVGSLPAAARQEPGPVVPGTRVVTVTHTCSLQRVGTQFVKCDDLTGNGEPAPAWVDEVD